VEEYATQFFETAKKKYEDMVKLSSERQDEIHRKQEHLRQESQVLLSRIQKFVTHLLMEA